MNRKYMKHFLAMLVGLLLIINGSAMTSAEAVFALDGSKGASEETAVLAFTSDVHNDQKNYTGETRLGTWIDNVKSKYGHLDVMAFGGDMAQYNSADARFWSETQRVMDVVAGKGITAYYTTGNHEYDHDSSITNDFYPDKNETTRKYIQNDWAVSDNDHNYRIYCMGVGEASNYTYAENAYTANQVSTLRDKLAAVDNSRPIFIITHFPLHYNSSRTITNASNIIDVLNTAATGGTPDDPSDDKKIVFLWGHNHSMSSPYDTHYDTIYEKGSSLQYDSSHTKEVQFFYAAAGSMCDTEKDRGSGQVEGKGLVATVDSNDLITLAYHKADGTTVTKNGGPFIETKPAAVERFTIDEDDESLSVEAGRKLQLNATVVPEEASDYTVTWSSSDTAIATVDNSGKVTGVSEGQAEITATLVDNVGGETRTASVNIEVVPRTTAGTPYVLTNTLTPGKNYLIVSANSGDAYALKNDNGSISKEAVTIDGNTIYTDDENIVFEAQGSGTTVNDLHNGDRYLKASSDDLQLLEVAGTSRPWEYNASNNTLRNYKSGSNPSYYYVYYDNSNNTFTLVKGTSTNRVYIFEETEPDATFNVTFKVKNGKWDDNTGADKTVKVTGKEGSVTLSEDKIPTAGTKPDSGYKEGSWDVTPDAGTPITGNVTYTYTYEEESSQGSGKAYVLTDEMKAGKKYIISNTNSGTAHVLTSSSTTAAEVTIDGDTIYTDDASIVFTMGEKGGAVNYIGNEDGYVNHTSDNYLEFVSTAPGGITWTYDGSYLTYKDGSTTYYLYYKSGTNYNRYRIKSQSSASSEQLVYLFEEVQTDVSYDVTFQVEHGKWNDDTTEEKTVTLTGAPGTELKLSADQIPAVGEKPEKHYEEGDWNVTPDTTTAITKDTTFKYTYAYADHVWDDGTVTTQPTCTAKGVKTFKCKNCDETRTEDVDALGHDKKAHAAAEATCTTAGNNAYWSCDRCHKYFSDEACENEVEEGSWVIPAGHDWSKPTYKWSKDNSSVTAEYHCTVETCNEEVSETVNTSSVVTKQATCEEAGTTKYTATFTNDEFAAQEKTDDTKPAALGHSWGKVTYTWSDDNKTVTAKRVCGRDDSHVEEEAVNTTSSITQEATCTLPEKTTWTAEFTNEAFEKQTKTEKTKEANGHDWSKPRYDWDDDFSSVTGHYNCTTEGCDVEVTETVNATSEVTKQATCTEAGETTYRATFEDPRLEAQEEVDATKPAAKGHKWDEGAVTTQPTCIAKGVKTFNCENCTETKTEEVAALGHNKEAHAAAAATCTKAGNSAYWSCGRCHKYFSDEACENEIKEDSWVISAKGHDYQTVAGSAQAATCTADGKEADKECTRCHDVIEGKKIDALGHDYQTVADSAQAATCTADGKEADQECSHCHDVITGGKIEKLGHDYQTVAGSAQAATCTADGKEADQECSHCHDEITGKKIDALGHDYQTVAGSAKDATCTADGKEADQECSHCHDEITGKKINKLGHDYQTVAGSVQAATCTADGKEADQECSHCHDVIEGKKINKLGHDYQTVEGSAKAATCTEDGKKADKKCTHCNDVITGEKIDALGHDYQEVAGSAKDATCTEDGHEDNKECTLCHDVVEGEKIEASGHSFGEWTEVTSSTCAAEGLEQRECETCGFIESKNLDLSEHVWDKESTVDVKETCTTNGSRSIHCKNCDAVKDSETIPAIGHSWDGEKVVRKATGTTDGVKTVTCRNCGVTRTEKINKVNLAGVNVGVTGNAGSKKATVQMTRINGANGYAVYYRKANSAKWATKSTAGSAKCTLSGLKAKEMYQIRAQATRTETATTAAVKGSYSSINYLYLSNVSRFKAKAGKRSATISWAKDTKATGYEIQYSTNKKMENARVIRINGKASTKRTIKNLAKGKTYYFRVRPVKKYKGKTYLGVYTAAKAFKVK